MRRLLILAVVVLLASAAAGWSVGLPRLRQALFMLLQLSGPPEQPSSGALSEHDLAELNAMSPQDQATRLLEKAINNYRGAREEISKRLESWTGKIHSTPELNHLTETAYFSNDLRVRAAALEIWLIRDGVRKDPQTVDDLILEAAATEERRYYRLSTLGILGNRGVEPEKVFEALGPYARDSSGPTRAAAINGLGLLGTENTVPVLLEILRYDSSTDLRDRAACNLADSGMLAHEARLTAVPKLIQFLEDPSLDQFTRREVLQALREITQQNIQDDPAAWWAWWSARAR